MNEQPRLRLLVSQNGQVSGEILDADGQTQANVYQQDSDVMLSLSDSSGATRVRLGVTDDGPLIDLLNEHEEPIARLK
jgi:hypothetical protein